MSRVSIARPMHVVGWVTALVALAWFATTQTHMLNVNIPISR